MNQIEQAEKILKENKQEKVLKILHNLNNHDREKLSEQIVNTDFKQLYDLYENREEKEKNNDKIEPIKYVNKNKLRDNEIEELTKLGKKAIKQGNLAVVTMAGGQGTRLGWKGPKGTFKLDIGDNGKYIFEILVDTLQKANRKYETEVNWYIMTSVDNNEDTINFFEKNNYFGYNKEKIKFFKQNVLPLMDFDGNLLIDRDFNIKQASDGNGGVFKSLESSGMLEDMKQKNIDWVYICGVDNIMANMVDSIFIGLAIKNKTLAASKSIKKAYPEEKVGSFCKKNGRPAVIEYSEMNENMIYAKDENGELLYGESHFVANLFNRQFLEKMARCNLKYHCAIKKNTYIDENLEEISPKKENSLKFESFIFDAFEYLDDITIMRVKREEEFAPIKNATGNDSPETAKKIYERNKFGK